jgi:hypothetical protein
LRAWDRSPYPPDVRRFALLLLALLPIVAGCPADDDDGFSQPTPPPEPVDPDTLCNTPGAARCEGFEYQVCVEGRWFTQQTCAAPTPFCNPDVGCTSCEVEQAFCVEREIWLCDDAGTTAEYQDTCGTGEECLFGECYSACDLAEQTESYLGCRFLAVPTANGLLAPSFWSDFAVVIGNAWPDDAAEITIRQSGTLLGSATIPPGETAAIPLDLLPELQPQMDPVLGTAESVRVANGAFEIVSTVPVAAYQYNPLHFEVVTGDYVESSFTNDASLLLPEHVLTGSYMASTWPTWSTGGYPGASVWYPGFVAVAATEDSTLVTVTTTANTQGGPVVSAMELGEDTVISLNRGDVLQLLAEVPEPSDLTNTCAERGGEQASNGEYDSCLDRALGDLTGTRIEADRPVAVFAGHVCTFMPFDEWACDHLEEMMFPVETWGTRAVMSAPAWPGRPDPEPAPTLIRVLSQADDNYVTFTPAVQEPVTLDAGEFVEFMALEDFIVEGQNRLFVTQALLGENALATNQGDPALGSGIPLAQWRDEYDFLVPETYTSNWVNVVASQDAVVFLDGLEIAGWEEIDGTIYKVVRLPLEPGGHRAESVGDVGFGITSYGYASYTSYLYPGGMNFLR